MTINVLLILVWLIFSGISIFLHDLQQNIIISFIHQNKCTKENTYKCLKYSAKYVPIIQGDSLAMGNPKNHHLWDSARHFQHEFKMNVWCDVIGYFFVGPFGLPPNLNIQFKFGRIAWRFSTLLCGSCTTELHHIFLGQCVHI